MPNPVLDYKRVRLKFESDKWTSAQDVLASATPQMYRGNDASFEVCIYWLSQIVDLSNMASLTLAIWTTDFKTRKISKTVSAAEITAIPTAAGWADGSEQHAVFAFTGLELNWALTGVLKEETFTTVLCGVTNNTPGRDITFGTTSLKIVEDGEGVSDETANHPQLYYTQADADARFVQLNGDGYTFRVKRAADGNVYQYFYFEEIGKWVPRIPKMVDGQYTLTWGEPED
jgi:hypothetical protein